MKWFCHKQSRQRNKNMNRKRTFSKLGSVACAILLACSSSFALAQSGADDDTATNHGSTNDEWQFTLAPLFLWGVNLNGEATIGDVTAPLDLDFKDDILANLEAVFTVHFEARKNKWTIFSELQYLDLQPEVTLSMGPITGDVDITFKNTLVELGGAYTFSENVSTRWEVIGGLRYTDQEIKVDVTLTVPPPVNEVPIKMNGGDNWTHAFAGIRVFHSLSEKWTFIGRADLGYGGSDNSAVNGAFMFDYRFKDWGSAFMGWRYLKYDFDNDSSTNRYAFDAYQQGPLLGLSIHW